MEIIWWLTGAALVMHLADASDVLLAEFLTTLVVLLAVLAYLYITGDSIG